MRQPMAIQRENYVVLKSGKDVEIRVCEIPR